ncbi:MAG: cell division protein ZipA C-terminal FtsZ-binding domain-containing protein [Gammaproteobacteria bacterium]|nr:cell division protein ZipA C-terminal FtsZ-binding domain-containing protein [Gammaproteobacteria bacterium]
MDLRIDLAVLGALVIGIITLMSYEKGNLWRRVQSWLGRRDVGAREVILAHEPAVDPTMALEERKVLTPTPETAATGGGAMDEGDESGADQPFDSIDFIIFLVGDGPVVRDAALGVYKQNEYTIDKPHKLYGRRLQGKRWSELARDPAATEYGLLAVALQLADRAGPVGESDLNNFSQVALKLADVLDRPTRLNMTFERALATAVTLDKFCSDHDVIASINISAETVTAFRGPAIERAAQEAGLRFGARDIFHRPGERKGSILYSLANLYKPGSFDPLRWDTLQTQGLTLFMSVPSVPNPEAAFADMARVARVIARRLGGKLLDQDRRPLSEAGITAISRQIAKLSARMQEHGIAPGGPQATRLFPP